MRTHCFSVQFPMVCVLEEFRAEACFRFEVQFKFLFDGSLPTQIYSGSFIRKNPMMFVDTTWVNIDHLREFLHEREAQVSASVYNIEESPSLASNLGELAIRLLAGDRSDSQNSLCPLQPPPPSTRGVFYD